MKPRKQDVISVAREMERGGDYRDVAYSAVGCPFPTDADYELKMGQLRSLIDAAIRHLLRSKDRVIRAARKLAIAYWSSPAEELARACVKDEAMSRFEDAVMELAAESDNYQQRRRERKVKP